MISLSSSTPASSERSCQLSTYLSVLSVAKCLSSWSLIDSSRCEYEKKMRNGRRALRLSSVFFVITLHQVSASRSRFHSDDNTHNNDDRGHYGLPCQRLVKNQCGCKYCYERLKVL